MIDLVQVETRSGIPVHWGGTRLVPFARVVRLRLPGLPVGLIWNRPASVLVTYPDGSEEVLPVPDPTRQATWVLAGLAFVSFLVWQLVNISKRRNLQ